jgi:hypothetical protein
MTSGSCHRLGVLVKGVAGRSRGLWRVFLFLRSVLLVYRKVFPLVVKGSAHGFSHLVVVTGYRGNRFRIERQPVV